jgi:hypothetical protein
MGPLRIDLGAEEFIPRPEVPGEKGKLKAITDMIHVEDAGGGQIVTIAHRALAPVAD